MPSPESPFSAGTDELRARLRNEFGVKWTRYEEDVIPMWIADMDFGTAEPVTEALHGAVDGFGLGYSRQSLYDGVLDAFVHRYRTRFHVELDPGLALLATDVVQSVYIAIMSMTAPGDGVVVQPPIYPPFIGAIQDTQRSVLYNRLLETPSGFQFDFDDLERMLADPSTRMLLLCNPHNPTGRVMTAAELDAVAEMAARHHVLVVADEIHADIVYGDRPHLPFATAAARFGTDHITLTSASKSFNLAGLRCAVAHFSSSALRAGYETFPFHMRGAVSNLGMVGTIAAWEHGEEWFAGTLAQLGANRQAIAEFARTYGIGYRMPEGTYLAWLDFSGLTDNADVTEALLAKARVGLSDGPAFGPGGDGHARLNFATTSANLAEALGRIADALPHL